METVSTARQGLRARHTEETRNALVQAARRLFAERGYHNVGVREFVAEAGLTRGALYHHFEGKDDLFLAVLEGIQSELKANAAARHRQPERPDRWTQLRNDLAIALDEMMAPDIVQILLLDAPSVLGWKRWREHRQAFGIAAISKAIETSIADGLIFPQPVEELAYLISGAFNEATILIAFADDQKAARKRAGEALDNLLRGLQIS